MGQDVYKRQVDGNAVPHLILYHQHTDFFKLLAQFLDVIADNPVINVHIALVVEHIEGAGYIDFKSRSDIPVSYTHLESAERCRSQLLAEQ